MIRLVDGQARHRRHPKTFQEIPSLETIKNLTIGDRVKLGFLYGEEVERMWVTITTIRPRTLDNYAGNLINRSMLIAELTPGTKVWFSRRHILSVE